MYDRMYRCGGIVYITGCTGVGEMVVCMAGCTGVGKWLHMLPSFAALDNPQDWSWVLKKKRVHRFLKDSARRPPSTAAS